MKKRLGIYVIYDEQNVICNADLYLAQEIRSVTSRLIVCVNGSEMIDTQKLSKYTDEIVVRDNSGYDAGAVKEVICSYLNEGELQNYEELVISNNSFFGPFIPMWEIFETMDSRECDYWGLSGYMGDKSIFWRGVGSYFWVFRKDIIKEHFLENFIEKYINEKNSDFMETCGIYECRLNYELMKRFKPDMYADVGALNIFDAGDLAMMKYSLPIIKRKFFIEKRTDFPRIINVLRFIADTGFNSAYVEDKLCRLYGIAVANDGGKWMVPDIKESEYEIPKTDITYWQIEDFLSANQSVYIYGTGYFATFIWAIFGEKYDTIKGFVTTYGTGAAKFHGYDIVTLDRLAMTDSVLVALNAEHTDEVRQSLQGKNCLFLHE